jgi:hypothetical protein
VEALTWGGELRMEASAWGLGRRMEAPAWGGERCVEASTWGDMWRCRREAAGGVWRHHRGAVHGWSSRLEGLFNFFNPCLVSQGTNFVGKDCNIFLRFQMKMVGHCLFLVKVVPENLSLGNFLGKLFP